LGLHDITARPEVWHRLAQAEVRRVFLAVILAHFPREFLVGLVWRSAARGQNNAGRKLVIWHILGHTFVNPFVPDAGLFAVEVADETAAVVKLLGVVTGEITQQCREPAGIAGAGKQLIDFFGPLSRRFI